MLSTGKFPSTFSVLVGAFCFLFSLYRQSAFQPANCIWVCSSKTNKNKLNFFLFALATINRKATSSFSMKIFQEDLCPTFFDKMMNRWLVAVKFLSFSGSFSLMNLRFFCIPFLQICAFSNRSSFQVENGF